MSTIYHNQSLGEQGETIAAEYLRKKGYRIRERNWRSKIGEIDIIAEKRGVVVFCEVKTRVGNAFGYPEEAVTATKQRHLIRTTELFSQQKRLTGSRRIDVIAVTIADGETPQIMHIEDAVGG